MSAPYVCIRCRQRVNSQVLGLWPPRFPRNRSFISLSTPNKPANDEDSVLPTARPRKGRAAQAKISHHDQQAVQRSQRPEPLESVNSMLERLFESTQRARPEVPIKSRYSQTLNPEYISVDEDMSMKSLRSDLATLQDSLDMGRSSATILAEMVLLPSFKDHEKCGTRNKEEKTLLFYSPLFHDVLLKAINERTTLQPSFPSPALVGIIQTYVAQGLMQDQWWHTTIWQLLAVLAESQLGHGGTLSCVRFQNSLHLLEDALQVLKIFTNVFCATSDVPEAAVLGTNKPVALYSEQIVKSSNHTNPVLMYVKSSRDWTGLKSLGVPRPVGRGPRPWFAAQFLHHFPKIAETPSTKKLAAAAVMTYICLRSAEKLNILSESLASDAQIFRDFMDQIVLYTSSGEAEFRRSFYSSLKQVNVLTPVADELYEEWTTLRRETRERRFQAASYKISELSYNFEDFEQHIKEEDAQEQMNETAKFSSVISGHLRKAVRDSDVKFALNLWRDQQDIIRSGQGLDYSVFSDFLTTFFALGRPDCASETWNTMCKHGCEPGIRQWTALLEGCAQARDLTSLRAIWRRIGEAKVQTTNQAWTVYISGLLLCKDWRSALQAVEELERLWASLNAAGAPATPVTKGLNEQEFGHEQDLLIPSIVPINATIAGLLGNRKHDFAEKVLRWAISKGIKPSTTTFNIFLRPAVRRDATEDTRRILSEMNQYACDPDVATFTIILDGVFRNPSSAFLTASAEAQQSLITRVFKDMHENGIKATAQTYSTILDGLLNPKYFNLSAARAVLSRMADQGVKPTPHIYTILISHYFSLSPPNLPAIDSLWRRIEFEKSAVDHVFYDRMIEGYGRAGALDKMLALLRRMPSAGKKPGWIALLGALKALAEAKEWDLVKDLVRDVADEREGLLRLGSRGWRGEQEFWDFVEALQRRGVVISLHGIGGKD